MLRYRILVISIVLCSFCTVYGQKNYDVLMQESPPGAGEIKPGTGMHTYQDKENITLTTAPKAGYHFVGWLGDVRDTTANRTSMIVDGPKIIIAVFERDEYQFSDENPQITQGPPGLFPNSQSYTHDGGTWDPPIHHHHDNPPDNPRHDRPPVPGGPEVPEPATMILLGLGAYLLRSNGKNSK